MQLGFLGHVLDNNHIQVRVYKQKQNRKTNQSILLFSLVVSIKTLFLEPVFE